MNKYLFTPTAWAKLICFRDAGPTEVAGFAVTDPQNSSKIIDVHLVKQRCTGATFDLDMEDVDEYMNKMLDLGIPPKDCSRILWHTHPGSSATPSGVDEDNFKKVFDKCDFGTMLIVSRTSEVYCRTRYNVGPSFDVTPDVDIDYASDFAATDRVSWLDEYNRNVIQEKITTIFSKMGKFHYLDYQTTTDDSLDEFDCFWHGDYVVCLQEDSGKWYWYDPIAKVWSVESDDTPELLLPENPPKKIQKLVESWLKQPENRKLEVADDLFTIGEEDDYVREIH